MKALDLALKAGRLRQSPITHFVHHCAEHRQHARETIPVFENFCFILALFRTKTADNVLEGKDLLEKLFAFQTAEGFPVYLHEYPQCRSRALLQKISLIAAILLRDFSSVLGEALRTRLQALLMPIAIKVNPQTPEDWAEFLIQTQITGDDQTAALQLWDFKALCFKGAQKQDRGEPAVTLFDLILGQWTGRYSDRAVQDHPVHLQASLIDPKTISLPEKSSEKKWIRRFWGEGSPTHSSMLHTQGEVAEEESSILIDLSAKEVQDEVEIAYFLNRHPLTTVSVSGKKATSFQMGESVYVASGSEKFEIVFSLVEGEGRFWGHLSFANRPGQKGALQHEEGVVKLRFGAKSALFGQDPDSAQIAYSRSSMSICAETGPAQKSSNLASKASFAIPSEAFDWAISLRTIERRSRCLVRLAFQPVGIYADCC